MSGLLAVSLSFRLEVTLTSFVKRSTKDMKYTQAIVGEQGKYPTTLSRT
jgi:hypothetical protein